MSLSLNSPQTRPKGVTCKLGANDPVFFPWSPQSTHYTGPIPLKQLDRQFPQGMYVHGAIEGTLQTMTTQMRRMAIGSWSMTLFVIYRLPSIITQALSTPSLQKRMQDDTLVKGVESMPMLKPKLHSRVSAIIII